MLHSTAAAHGKAELLRVSTIAGRPGAAAGATATGAGAGTARSADGWVTYPGAAGGAGVRSRCISGGVGALTTVPTIGLGAARDGVSGIAVLTPAATRSAIN